MVSNAKSFNETNSPIYSYAEKVRKLVSNFMVERNPAYKDKNYQAVATPIPQDLESKSTKPPPQPSKPSVDKKAASQASKSGADKKTISQASRSNEDPKGEVKAIETKSGRRTGRNASRTSPDQNSRGESSLPASQDEEVKTEEYKGLSFQEAQLKIIQSMMDFTDEE